MRRCTIFFSSLLFIVLSSACSTTMPQKKVSVTSSPTLMEINGQKVSTAEFEYLYEKNNTTQKDSLWTKENLEEYLELYTNFKLKVEEAKSLKLDTAKSFKREFETYKNQLAQPYLTPKNVSNQLVEEAYQRLQTSVRAAHILIMVEPYADPKDTLEAYNKIKDIRQRAIKGEPFGELAKKYSQDPSGQVNGGDLYYFSAMQMVYPFETAAYQTKENTISDIVRTRFGYHILNVKDKSPSLGKVEIAHIMVRSSEGMIAEDTLKAYRKIQEIYDQLQDGGSFEQLARQFSDDFRSKQQGGRILNNGNPEFTSGTLVPPFEEKIQDLEKGEITAPFKTAFGWHIVKLLNKKPIEPLSELRYALEQKIAKDSRAEVQKTVLVERLKQENGFELSENVDQILQWVAQDSSLSKSESSLRVFVDNSPDLDKNDKLFSVAGKNDYLLSDFVSHLEGRLPAPKNALPFLRMQLDEMIKDKVIDYERSILAQKYPDYRFLVQEYYDGILLFKIMEEKVWAKALEDKAGLEQFYQKNKENYRWKERAKTRIYSLDNQQTLLALQDSLKRDYFYLNTFEPVVLEIKDNSSKLSDSQSKKIAPLADAIIRNPDYLLSLRLPESTSLNTDSLYQKLSDRGISKERVVLTKTNGKNLVLQLVSQNSKTLESSFNKENALRLQTKEGFFEQEEDLLSQVEWKKGVSTIENEGRVYYLVIDEILPARTKELEETRGVVISDYQKYLENEWISSLRQKYDWKINQKVLEQLITQNQN